MNVKSDWFRFGLPASRFDPVLWKPTALPWQAMQLDVASGTAGASRRSARLSPLLSGFLSAWLYVSSVEFARKGGAGEQVMSGCLTKSVWGAGVPAFCVCSPVQ